MKLRDTDCTFTDTLSFPFFFSVKICFFPFCIIVFDYAFILYIFKVDDYLSKPFNLYNKSAE